MPKVSKEVIQSVFYLYATKQDALDGKSPGGTGFVVAVPINDDALPSNAFYGVTNWHVACDGGYSVVRLNTLDGGCDVVEVGPEDWSFIPSGPDVAVLPINLDSTRHKTTAIHSGKFVRKNDLSHIGVGEDVFMLGLFVGHAGTKINIPSARFGNISMMPNPNATIKQPTQYQGESFVLDLGSRTGYSGSPVFVYRTPLGDLTGSFPMIRGNVDAPNIAHQLSNSRFTGLHDVEVSIRLPHSLLKLLGIHWGQFQDEVKGPHIPKDQYVSGLSGMTCVIPAWEILEVLDLPKLKELRSAKIE